MVSWRRTTLALLSIAGRRALAAATICGGVSWLASPGCCGEVEGGVDSCAEAAPSTLTTAITAANPRTFPPLFIGRSPPGVQEHWEYRNHLQDCQRSEIAGVVGKCPDRPSDGSNAARGAPPRLTSLLGHTCAFTAAEWPVPFFLLLHEGDRNV